MAIQDFGHDCDRFRRVGLECPFRRLPEDDDDQDEEEQKKRAARELADEGRGSRDLDIPLFFPGKRPNDADAQRPLRFPVTSRPLIERGIERVAAFQRVGELQSIPPVKPGAASQEAFPFNALTPRALIASLSAIMIMQGLRALRSQGFSTASQGVARSEKRSARVLSQGLAQSPGQGPLRGPGRGGMHVQESTFRNLLRRPRIIGSLTGGFDSFSETGFN